MNQHTQQIIFGLVLLALLAVELVAVALYTWRVEQPRSISEWLNACRED